MLKHGFCKKTARPGLDTPQKIKQKLNNLGISSDQAQKIIDNKSVNIPLDERIINDKPSVIDRENINKDLENIYSDLVQNL